MKFFRREVNTRLSRFTYRTKCPKCGEYNDKMNVFFHDPCISCSFMAKMNGSIKEKYGYYKEVGKWKITETRFKVFGVSFKKTKTFEWIPKGDEA